MKRETKLLVFILLVATVAIFLVIYRYEKLLIDKEKERDELMRVIGGIKKEYTAQEIIRLIKNSPAYLGDTLLIYENGDMVSSSDKFTGTLQAVLNSEGNMTLVKSAMKQNKLPLQYNVYVLASNFYKQQYPDEFKRDTVRHAP